MGFAAQESRQEHFKDILDTLSFVDEEQRRIYRLPLKPYLEQGARFTGDKDFGVGDTRLNLNEYGFDQLCRLIGTNSNFLQRLEEPELASRILNDVLLSSKTTRPLDNLELLSQSPNLTLDSYRALGRNAALYALGKSAEPVAVRIDNTARLKHIVRAALFHRRELEAMVPGARPVELDLIASPEP